jgi:hypothetical protein
MFRPTRRPMATLWHPALALAFLSVAYIGPDIVSILRNPGSLVKIDLTVADIFILVVGFAIVGFELIKLIISLVQFAPAKIFSHLLALAILSATFLFGKQISIAVQHFNLSVFHSRYAACEQAAESYSDASRFQVCSISGHGNAYTMIVFDSGDEISLPTRQRLGAFSEFLRSKITLILSECRSSIGTRLDDHFYLVQSDCDSRPD